MPYEDRYKSGAASAEKRSHRIGMEDRKKLNISGVLDVERFDEREIVMETEAGTLYIRGEKLEMGSFSTDSGDVSVQGQIAELCYEDTVPKQSFWARLLH